MSSELHVTAEHDGSVSNAAVRDALSGLDVSESSPITADASQVGISHSTEADGEGDDGEVHHHVELHVSGHDGEWTKTSQEALLDALKDLDGVDVESVSVEGGHESG